MILALVAGCAATGQLHAGPLVVRPNTPDAELAPEGMVGAEAMISISDHVGFGVLGTARAGQAGGSFAGGVEVCGVSSATAKGGFFMGCIGDHLVDVGYRNDDLSLAIGSPLGHLALAMRAGNTLVFLNLWGGWDAQLRGGPSRAWAGISLGIGNGYNAYR